MEIYLIRHTKPEIGRGICYGQSDLEVADSFLDEYSELRKRIPDDIQAWYSSPLKRCSMLAKKLSAEVDVNYRDGLKELAFGEWEMKSWKDLPREETDHWGKNYESVAPPGGETFLEVNERVLSVWKEITALDFEKVALVAHAGPIRCILAHVLGMPLSKSFRIGMDYAHLSKVILEGDWVNVRINE